MDLSELERLQPQVGTLRLSEAIRIGCPMVKENILFSGCALGTAYFALTGRDLGKEPHKSLLGGSWRINLVAEAFRVPYEVAERVSNMHFRGGSREQCADYLESQGL